MFYAKFDIEGVKKIYQHSIANPIFTPTFSQMFEGKYRKDGKDLPVDGKYWPKADEVDNAKLPKQVFIVKDRGAYIMAATEKTLPGDESMHYAVYCEGCDPNKDEDYWPTQQSAFGGDDFSEALPLDWLQQAIKNAERLGIDSMIICVKPETMELVTGKRM